MSDNRYYMACLDLQRKSALVVGAGPVALEKIAGLLTAGADVTVVAPRAGNELLELVDQGSIAWEERPYQSGDLDNRFIVVVATSDRALNERVSQEAQKRNLLVNVADVPELCNFILPAVHRSGPLAVAVSTAGASPALAKRIRREAADRLSASYARLAEILEDLRPWAKANLDGYDARRDFFETIVEGVPDPISLLDAGAEKELIEHIEDAKNSALEAQRRPTAAEALS